MLNRCIKNYFNCNYPACNCERPVACECGKTPITHCRSFADLVWFGCKKVLKPVIEKGGKDNDTG